MIQSLVSAIHYANGELWRGLSPGKSHCSNVTLRSIDGRRCLPMSCHACSFSAVISHGAQIVQALDPLVISMIRRSTIDLEDETGIHDET